MRPLPRTYRGRPLPATPPDRTETWQEDGVLLRAEVWTDLVLQTDAPKAKVEAKAKAKANGPTFTAVAVYDPRYREPLLLASPLPVGPRVLRDLYRDRWAVEQLPLARLAS